MANILHFPFFSDTNNINNDNNIETADCNVKPISLYCLNSA